MDLIFWLGMAGFIFVLCFPVIAIGRALVVSETQRREWKAANDRREEEATKAWNRSELLRLIALETNAATRKAAPLAMKIYGVGKVGFWSSCVFVFGPGIVGAIGGIGVLVFGSVWALAAARVIPLRRKMADVLLMGSAEDLTRVRESHKDIEELLTEILMRLRATSRERQAEIDKVNNEPLKRGGGTLYGATGELLGDQG